MKTIKLLSIFIWAFACAFVEAKVMPAPEKIKVLIEKDIDEALLELRGSYVVLDGIDKSRLSSGLSGKRCMIRATENGIKWGEEFPVMKQILIQPKHEDGIIIINGLQYSGSLWVHKKNEKLSLINELDVESYIKSVLSQEFSCPSEKEVLSSVAITARTTAYFNITKNQKNQWHVTSKNPPYNGSALVIPDSTICEAIDATRHMILLNQSGENASPFEAVWTDHCAGATAPYSEIFRKESSAPHKPITAPHAAIDRENSKWNYTISKTELAKKIGLQTISSIDLFQEKTSKKIYAFRLKNNAQYKDIDFFSFQELLGLENLKSNDLKVNIKDDKVIFTGYGKGHGVGLCLYSSTQMAKNGEDATKILNKFFPDTTLINLNQETIR